MIAATIPDAVHICPGCEDVTGGELYCEACRRMEKFYDNLLTATGYRAAGETAPIEDVERERTGSLMVGALWAIALEVWAVAMGFAVHFIWLHWK